MNNCKTCGKELPLPIKKRGSQRIYCPTCAKQRVYARTQHKLERFYAHKNSENTPHTPLELPEYKEHIASNKDEHNQSALRFLNDTEFEELNFNE